MKEPVLTPEAARVLNFVGLLALIGVLAGAYIYQFSYRELPCTLCLLQRLAMLGLAFGAALNLTFGPQPRYYGLCLVSAVFGIGVSIRQTLLHINPYFDTDTGQPTLEATTNPPFGSPVFGLDLYVWGVVMFATAILAIGVALDVPRPVRAGRGGAGVVRASRRDCRRPAARHGVGGDRLHVAGMRFRRLPQ